MSPAAHAAAKRSRPRRATAAGRRGREVVFGYIPALDGLRALAVLGVMCYHGGAPILGGGFLTIDVFFVLSGFLITSLLVGEWGKTAAIRLGQFWTRRARRLLPALFLLLVGVALYVKVLVPSGQFANLRLDSLSTLFYVANWHFIMSGSNYFVETARTSPLAHMWTLSIEEQFYLVWPPVVVAMLTLGRRLRPSRRLWPVLGAALAGSVGSAVAMALLYTGPASVMRVYEGTDTRSQDLLVGAALAVAMAMWAERRPALGERDAAAIEQRAVRAHPAAQTAGTVPSPARRRDLRRRRGPAFRPIVAWEVTGRWVRALLQVLGWGAVAVFAYYWSHLHVPTPFLYRGGYYLVAVGVAVIIFCSVTDQLGWLSRALGNRVFRYVGKISYGAYLWHFPLFAVLDAERVHLYGYPLLAVRIGATLAVASASFYLVEEPVRRGRMRSLAEWRAWLATSGSVAVVVGLTLFATAPVPAEAQAPLAAPTGARYAGPPVRVAMFGDSVAWRMASAMLLSQPQQAYDVDLDNAGIFGCGVVRSTEYRVHGAVNAVHAACNSGSPPSEQWPALWNGDLAQFHPDVVMLMAGRWEVTDRLIGGSWEHAGQPAFDADLKASLEQAVRVGTSRGALMMLLTAPCFSSGEQPNGRPWPADSSARLAVYNATLRAVAKEFPRRTEVVDIGAQMCPGGKFQLSVDGVRLRDADGVHVVPTATAGQWLDQRLLPEAVRLGRLQLQGLGVQGAPRGSSLVPARTGGS